MESMERELFLENLDAVVERIIELHTTSSERWCETNDHMMPNLKKTQVSDAYGNNDILLTILQHREYLETLDITEEMEGYTHPEFEVKSRVKMTNSIVYKVKKYTSLEHHGKVPLNKCMNDLMGIRVIVNCDIEHNEICAHIHDVFGLKCIDSSKTDPVTGIPTYIATHVYFKDDNRQFPWELQIWLTKNAENNYNSHERCKQDYKEWNKVM